MDSARSGRGTPVAEIRDRRLGTATVESRGQYTLAPETLSFSAVPRMRRDRPAARTAQRSPPP